MIRTIDDTQEPGGDPFADRLRAAAPLRPTGVSYADVQRRAGSLRRRRRAVQAGGLALVVAAGVAAATVLPVPTPLRNRAEVAGVPDLVTQLCDTAVRPRHGTPADVPDLLYLPSRGVSGSPDGVTVSTEREACDTLLPVAALGYRVENGRTTQGVLLSGPVDPGVIDQKLRPDEAVSVPVRTGTLSLRTRDGDDPEQPANREGWWVDGAGHAWWVEAETTTAALADLVGDLRVEHGRIDLDSLPASMTTVLGPDDVPFRSTAGWSYEATWTEADPPLFEYRVTEGTSLARILATTTGARPVSLTVNGAQRRCAWMEAEFSNGLYCELGDGLMLNVFGPGRQDAEQVAESTVKVAADDPRLVGRVHD